MTEMNADRPHAHGHDHHGHGHGGHHHDGHAHGDHDDHGHEHGGVEPMDGVRIAVAAICAAALWFVEAGWLAPDAWAGQVRAFLMQAEPWPSIGLGDLIPGWAHGALSPAAHDWIDRNLTLPFSTFAAVVIFFSGWPILSAAFRDLRRRRMTMELSMTIAIVAAAYTAHFFVAAIIIFFVLIAEVLESMTVERGRRAIRELLDFLPREVRVRRAGGVADVATDELAIGEVVLVAPGGRIPVDGVVVGGNSFADESRITGESMPVEKLPGATVFAGSINQTGMLEIEAHRIGADTSYGKIIEAVERADTLRAPVTRLADRIAGYIVLVAVSLATWTWLRFGDVDLTISVLVVAGACGVAAGTPLAILGAIGRAAKLGAIVKGGVHMETLTGVDMVVFDKTGTLTIGTPQVTAVAAAAGTDEAALLAAAAGAEFGSEHPLGAAIVAHAQSAGIAVTEPSAFAYTPGRGIAATVAGRSVLVGSAAWMADNGIAVDALGDVGTGAETLVYVAEGGALLGAVAVADAVRPEAAEAVRRIHAMGIRTMLLSGDNERVAGAVARQLGIAEVEASLLPEEKLERVRALVKSGRTVAMVGDGVNDALALAAAKVGVAMGSGTDVARESGDVVLLGNDLRKFAETLALARWTRRIIWQNFAGTILIALAGVTLAYLGIIGPVIAVQVHTASELLFILNSARIMINIGSEVPIPIPAWLRRPPEFGGAPRSSGAGPAAGASSLPGKVSTMVNLYALRPAWTPLTVLVIVIAFILFWPIGGLLVIAYIVWGDRIPGVSQYFAEMRPAGGGASHSPRPGRRTGNAMFDDYREAELRRLEEERARLDKESAEFEAYIEELRRARDAEEFERFRNRRPGGPE